MWAAEKHKTQVQLEFMETLVQLDFLETLVQLEFMETLVQLESWKPWCSQNYGNPRAAGIMETLVQLEFMETLVKQKIHGNPGVALVYCRSLISCRHPNMMRSQDAKHKSISNSSATSCENPKPNMYCNRSSPVHDWSVKIIVHFCCLLIRYSEAQLH